VKPICAFLCLAAVPVFAAVDGTVTNRTTGKPAAGATVTLYKLGQAGMESVESVKSGADGRFHMDQTPQGPHLVQTAFDGVTYNHMLPPGTPSTGLTLEVYNAARQPGSARVARHFLIFQPSGSQMAVDEGFQFQNDGLTTYNDPDGGTLKFYAPPGATRIVVKATAPQGMPIDRAAEKTRQPDVYKVDFPIKPGETDFRLTYSLPYTSGTVFHDRVLYKTDEPTLLGAPSGVTLKADGLESKGVEPRSQTSIFAIKGSDFQVEIAGAVPAASGGQAADSDADSGPSLEEVAPKVLRGNMKWILALALGILALGFIVLYRAQPAALPTPGRPSTAKGKNDRGRR